MRTETNKIQPLVSIVYPVYGVENYIEESLKSLLNQSYSNIEIVIVNDGSKDNSMEIVHKILKDDIKYNIINQNNSGLPTARNTGFNKCNGEFVCFIDSDDIISDTHIENLVNALLIENETKIAYSDFEITSMKDRYGSSLNKFNGIQLDYALFIEEFLTRKRKIHCCSLLINRKFLIDEKLTFNVNLTYGEDVDFMWRLFTVVNKIIYVPIKSYKYLVRKNSLMTSQNIEKVVRLVTTFELTSTLASSNLMKMGIDLPSEVLHSRVSFGAIHAFARNSTYKQLRQLLAEIDYKSIKKGFSEYPDFKMRLLSMFLTSKSFLLYLIFKIEKFIFI